MIGHIESYNNDVQTGVIKYEGKFFEFYIDVWTSEKPPKAGDDVDFLLEDGAVTEVGLLGAYVKDVRPVKRRAIATALGLILGAVGAHRFYLGFYGIGLMQAAVTLATGGFGVVWGFVEGFLLFTGHINKDAKGRPLK
jgi:TM2 domain